MICGHHHHDGIRVGRKKLDRSETDAGSRVSSAGLFDNVTRRDLGQLLSRRVRLDRIRHHPELFRSNIRLTTVEGRLDERSLARQRQELLGERLTALWPEPSPTSSSHDDSVLHDDCRSVKKDCALDCAWFRDSGIGCLRHGCVPWDLAT